MSAQYNVQRSAILKEVRDAVGIGNYYVMDVCGSRAVLRDACPDHSDWDVSLVPMANKRETIFAALLGHGFTNESDNPEYQNAEALFVSFRRAELNVLVLRDEVVFEMTALSTQICRAFNMTSREDRVAVHQMVRDKYSADMLGPVTNIGALTRTPSAFYLSEELRASVKDLAESNWNYDALMRVYRAIRSAAGF